MKFVTSSGELQRLLTRVSSVVPPRSTMPILENLLLNLANDILTITATDMEISMTVAFQVKGSEDGRFAVPAKRLADTIRALPENTTASFDIDTRTSRIKITTSNGEYTLTGEPLKISRLSRISREPRRYNWKAVLCERSFIARCLR